MDQPVYHNCVFDTPQLDTRPPAAEVRPSENWQPSTPAEVEMTVSAALERLMRHLEAARAPDCSTNPLWVGLDDFADRSRD